MYDNDYRMTELALKASAEYIAIKFDMFEPEIIDKQNFKANIFGIIKFKHKYIKIDCYMIL